MTTSTIGGKDIICPHCKKLIFVQFDSTLSNEELDEITKTLRIRE